MMAKQKMKNEECGPLAVWAAASAAGPGRGTAQLTRPHLVGFGRQPPRPAALLPRSGHGATKPDKQIFLAVF